MADGFETVITSSRGHGLFISATKGKSPKVEANADLIVKAVNNHDELVNVSKRLVQWFAEGSGGQGPIAVLNMAEKILAKIEETK